MLLRREWEWYNFHTVFEYDPAKSAANKVKHGIDFEEAKALWGDRLRVEVDARYDRERRWLLVGKLNGKIWTAVFARRGDAMRIISVRRARAKEVDHYEQGEND